VAVAGDLARLLGPPKAGIVDRRATVVGRLPQASSSDPFVDLRVLVTMRRLDDSSVFSVRLALWVPSGGPHACLAASDLEILAGQEDGEQESLWRGELNLERQPPGSVSPDFVVAVSRGPEGYRGVVAADFQKQSYVAANGVADAGTGLWLPSSHLAEQRDPSALGANDVPGTPAPVDALSTKRTVRGGRRARPRWQIGTRAHAPQLAVMQASQEQLSLSGSGTGERNNEVTASTEAVSVCSDSSADRALLESWEGLGRSMRASSLRIVSLAAHSEQNLERPERGVQSASGASIQGHDERRSRPRNQGPSPKMQTLESVGTLGVGHVSSSGEGLRSYEHSDALDNRHGGDVLDFAVRNGEDGEEHFDEVVDEQAGNTFGSVQSNHPVPVPSGYAKLQYPEGSRQAEVAVWQPALFRESQAPWKSAVDELIEEVIWEEDLEETLGSSVASSLKLQAASTSHDAGRHNGHDLDDPGDDRAVAIPEAPVGRVLAIRVHSTWGDPHFVGLAGVDVFDAAGRALVPCRVTAPDVSMQSGSEGDPRSGACAHTFFFQISLNASALFDQSKSSANTPPCPPPKYLNQ